MPTSAVPAIDMSRKNAEGKVPCGLCPFWGFPRGMGTHRTLCVAGLEWLNADAQIEANIVRQGEYLRLCKQLWQCLMLALAAIVNSSVDRVDTPAIMPESFETHPDNQEK